MRSDIPLTDDELKRLLIRIKRKEESPDVIDLLSDEEITKLESFEQLPTSPASAEQFMPPGPEGSALSRVASNAGELLNPVNLAKGLYGAVRHPVDTITSLDQARQVQTDKGKAAFGQGNIVEGIGHLLASFLPALGPASADAGEQIASGDIAGGVGKGLALMTPSAVPPIVRGVRGAITAGARGSIASSLEASAADRVAGVMSPKVGRQKVRFGNKAEKVAPELLKRGDAGVWTREALHQTVKDGLRRGRTMLDAAADERLPGRPIDPAPIKAALLKERAKYTAEPFEASRLQPDVSLGVQRTPGGGQTIGGAPVKTAVPMGESVVPGPNQARVAVIDKALAELERLGPQTKYESLRTMRQAYDGPAEVVYNPAMTADFLTQKGGALGAADVTGAIRSTLAKADPRTATANAEFTLYKSTDDVLTAVAEVERTRPRVGRAIMARLMGTMTGQQAAGLPGAAAGFVLGPIADSAMASGFTVQLKAAQLMQDMASAVRAGNVGQVGKLSDALRRLGAQGATIQGATSSPTESRSTGVPAWQPQTIR